jgi:hypothetical protein
LPTQAEIQQPMAIAIFPTHIHLKVTAERSPVSTLPNVSTA